MKSIEYRVRPVTRFIVTRFESESTDAKGCVASKGEFDNEDVAYAVAYALCKEEHERLGYPVGDERIQYPKRHVTGQIVGGGLGPGGKVWSSKNG